MLLDESFYLFNFVLFLMLLISSSISAYASLFKSKEVPFLLTQNVMWHEIYFIKTLEALWFSSCSFLFIAIPFATAYTITRSITLINIPIIVIGFYMPLIFLATSMGALAALFTVWALPTKRRQKIAVVLAVVGVAILLMRSHPEIIRQQGSISGILSGYLPHVAYAKHALLPSTWATKGMLALNHIAVGHSSYFYTAIFYFLVLLSNALFIVIPPFS